MPSFGEVTELPPSLLPSLPQTFLKTLSVPSGIPEARDTALSRTARNSPPPPYPTPPVELWSVVLDKPGLGDLPDFMTPAWSCSSKNPTGSELVDLWNIESSLQMGKLSQEGEGVCPEPQSLPLLSFLLYPQGRTSRVGFTAGWIVLPPHPGHFLLSISSHHNLSHPSGDTSSMQPPQISPESHFLLHCPVLWIQHRRRNPGWGGGGNLGPQPDPSRS